MSKSSNKNLNGKFLITRNGLEKLNIVKENKNKLCLVALRKNKNEYIYKTRVIENPNANDIKIHGLKK